MYSTWIQFYVSIEDLSDIETPHIHILTVSFKVEFFKNVSHIPLTYLTTRFQYLKAHMH